MGSAAGRGAACGHCPPEISRKGEGLLGPPLAVRGWTQLVAHVRPSPGSCSFPGVAGPPGPLPCSTGLAVPADREGEPAPPPFRGSLLARRSRRRPFLEQASTRSRRRRHGHEDGPHWRRVLGAGPSRNHTHLGVGRGHLARRLRLPWRWWWRAVGAAPLRQLSGCISWDLQSFRIRAASHTSHPSLSPTRGPSPEFGQVCVRYKHLLAFQFFSNLSGTAPALGRHSGEQRSLTLLCRDGSAE